MYNQGISLRSNIFRIGFFAASLGLGLSMLPPWGVNVRSFGGDQIDRFWPDDYAEVNIAAATNSAEDLNATNFPAEFAVDGQPARAWAVSWNAAVPLPAECGQQPTGAAVVLQLQLAEPTRVDRVTIRNGLAADNPNVGKHATPRTVDLLFPDGTCERVVLEDTPEPQDHPVEVDAVQGVTVSIADVYPALAADSTIVSLSEITLETET